MTREAKLALAKAAVREMKGLRWNRGSWDYALFEKRFRVGIALEERSPNGEGHGTVVVRDDDTEETLASRVRHALGEAGWGKRPRSGAPRERWDEDEFAVGDDEA